MLKLWTEAWIWLRRLSYTAYGAFHGSRNLAVGEQWYHNWLDSRLVVINAATILSSQISGPIGGPAGQMINPPELDCTVGQGCPCKYTGLHFCMANTTLDPANGAIWPTYWSRATHLVCGAGRLSITASDHICVVGHPPDRCSFIPDY